MSDPSPPPEDLPPLSISPDHVLIIGAGLAGLTCARHLLRGGQPCLILEAGDRAGGRIRTDRHPDGFLLDRGFQVFLSAYPEAQRQLDYERLRLRSFYPGALVHLHGRFHRVADPFRRPAGAFPTLLSPVGTLADKMRVGRLRFSVLRGEPEDLFGRPDLTTLQSLQQRGFSPTMIERFFRPFFGGVFLDPELRTSSRLFEFTYRMFAEGDTTLPEGGMEEIPRQIAADLPEGTIRFHTSVASVSPDGHEVTLSTGDVLRPRAVVLATDGITASRLTGGATGPPPPFHGEVHVTFAAPEPPITEPILILNAEPGSGPVNDMCVPSNVSPAYAPQGQALISCTILGNPPRSDQELEAEVRAQMEQWFGSAPVRPWIHLQTLRIPRALPAQPPGTLDPPQKPIRIPSLPRNGGSGGLFLCGDYQNTASQNGAMISGRKVAEAILQTG